MIKIIDISKYEGTPVKNIQMMLREIAKKNYNIETVTPDGIFGEKTKKAVMDFQDISGLDKTGEVDCITFEKIVSLYIKCNNNSSFKSILPYEKNENMLYINTMLLKISENYNNLPDIDVDDTYNESTKIMIKKIKEISNTDDLEIIDEKTFNLIFNITKGM